MNSVRTLISLLTFKMVLMTDVGVNESLFFSLYADPNDAYECPNVLLNVD